MKNIHSKQFKIGMLGGGQLGRMALQEAYNLNLNISILDPSENAPSKNLTGDFVKGNFKDYDTVYQFGKDKDVVTIEFEDVNSDALLKLESEGVKVFPQPKALKIIQDKGLQKLFYQEHDIPTSRFELIENKAQLKSTSLNFPIFQKLRTSGYDGYGVQSIENIESIEKAFDSSSMIEEAVELDKELSVIVARNEKGECKTFPIVEMEFNPKANMVEFLFSPANVSADIESEAEEIAVKIIEKLEMVGLLAVELFLDKKGNILVNEVAPRTHNSGHHTIEANMTSQFGQHLRAILNLPLGDTSSKQAAVMVNLLGEENASGQATYEGMEDILKIPGVHPHLYGKEEVKPFRKMGHITIVHEDIQMAKKIAKEVKSKVKATNS